MNTLHQYLCGGKANKQEITEICLSDNDLTGASSHLIAEIISHLQPHTLVLDGNNITNVRDISTAVITTSTVKVLDMRDNYITAPEVVAVSDMMICLEELCISGNELGDHGAELLSEGITNTKIMRVLNINNNNIGPLGTASVANALTKNTSLEELYMNNPIGQDGAVAIGDAISNNKILKKLSLCSGFFDYDEIVIAMDKESAMTIIKNLFNNNTIAKLNLPIMLSNSDISDVTREVEKVNSARKLHSNQHPIDFYLLFYDSQDKSHLGEYCKYYETN